MLLLWELTTQGSYPLSTFNPLLLEVCLDRLFLDDPLVLLLLANLLGG
jgi:hypothetical protein